MRANLVRMRVVIACPTLEENVEKIACGIGLYTVDLGRALESLGCEVFLTNELADVDYLVSVEPDAVVVQHEYSFFWDVSLEKLLRRLRREGRRRGFKTFVVVHGWNDVYEEQNEAIELLAENVVVHREDLKWRLVERGVDDRRVHVVPMGFRRFDFPTEKKRKPKGGRSALIASFGFLEPYKNFVRLVEALRVLRDEHGYNPTLVLCGFSKGHVFAESYGQLVDRAARASRINVIKVGHSQLLPLERIVNTLHSSDCVVLPYKEPLSYSSSAALRDCISSLTPVVVPDIRFFADVPSIQESEAEGCVFKVADSTPETLASGIAEVLENEALREKLIENAKKMIEKYSWERVAKKWIELLQT